MLWPQSKWICTFFWFKIWRFIYIYIINEYTDFRKDISRSSDVWSIGASRVSRHLTASASMKGMAASLEWRYVQAVNDGVRPDTFDKRDCELLGLWEIVRVFSSFSFFGGRIACKRLKSGALAPEGSGLPAFRPGFRSIRVVAWFWMRCLGCLPGFNGFVLFFTGCKGSCQTSQMLQQFLQRFRPGSGGISASLCRQLPR